MKAPVFEFTVTYSYRFNPMYENTIKVKVTQADFERYERPYYQKYFILKKVVQRKL